MFSLLLLQKNIASSHEHCWATPLRVILVPQPFCHYRSTTTGDLAGIGDKQQFTQLSHTEKKSDALLTLFIMTLYIMTIANAIIFLSGQHADFRQETFFLLLYHLYYQLPPPSLSQMSRAKLMCTLPWREKVGRKTN